MTLAAPSHSILVIDDDEGILRVFRRIFEKRGYAVATAGTGKEAKEMLRRCNFEVSLVDLTLPDINGADLLPWMKKNSPNMVKVVITGFSSFEKENIIEKGADFLLEKPVQPQVLIDLLEEKLKNKSTSQLVACL